MIKIQYKSNKDRNLKINNIIKNMTQSNWYLDFKYYLIWRSKMISYPPRSGTRIGTNLEGVKENECEQIKAQWGNMRYGNK